MVVSMQAGKLLRDRFCLDVTQLVGEPRVLVYITQSPTGAFETITNYEDLGNKITYLMTAYDECFRLRSKTEIKVVGYLLI